ncbi:major facilitator superfamily MFS-1 transporter [Burkholderia plantarii]|uniref:Major facilitator superfamily MFS-1 transporter n=2 Tax=Burkholderia plantarii TaxID=41899 RepID=A0A0B6RQK6_BURPL|nr:major facilitator superfamily MFS-1 transporter [Burkholderia plantarii]
MRGFGAGLMFGLLAEQTVMFAVPLLIYQHSGNVAYSGAAFALEWIPALVTYPFAGLMADLLGGRFLFIHANLARAVCLLLSFVVCGSWPALTVPMLMLNGALLSVLMAPIRMAVEKTVPALAVGGELSRMQALVQNVELLAMAAGPGIAAGLAYLFGKLPLLVIAGVAFVTAAACWRSLAAGTRRSGLAARQVGQDLALGWRLLWRNRPVIRLAVMNFSINIGFAVALSANAYVITGRFGASDGVFGLMNACAGALGLVNLMLMPWLLSKWSIDRIGVVGFAALCVGLVGMGGAPDVWLYIVGFLVFMMGDAIYNVFNRTQRVKAIESEHLGKVIGPFYLINSLSLPLGGLITAGLGKRVGIQPILLGVALLLSVAGGALLWDTIRHFRARFDADASHAEAARVDPTLAVERPS